MQLASYRVKSKFPHIAVAIFAGILPIGICAHSYGPPPRVTGAPGDNARACTACHSGSALNSGTGSVKILLASGAVYIPGVKQRIAVQVSDPVQKRWGFELTARLNSDLEKGQAGDFTPIDNLTQVICEDNAPKPCASGVTFITHTSAGTRNGLSPGSATFQFDWTPPAADSGAITFYVAGNAANADSNLTGDLIYTSSVELAPAIPVAPSVTAGSIVNVSGAAGPMAANSWGTVYGSNLGVTTRTWTDGDFLNGGIPFSLDGVSVVLTQFGAPRLAYVGYVSPTQINFLLPSDLNPTGTTLQIRNPAGISTAFPITLQAGAAQLFTLDGKYVYATHADGSFVGKAGLLPTLTTSPAVPGETLTVSATGLGATTPALIPGQLPATAATLVTLPQATIGGSPANVVAGGIVPGAAGQYTIRVQVPSDAANGDLPMIIQVGTVSSAPALLTVQK